MEIKKLVNELIAASEAYYSGKELLMTDAEFDSKQSYLEKIYDTLNTEEQAEVDKVLGREGVTLGATLNVTDKVVHQVPMLSLAKANSAETLNKFLDKIVKQTGSELKVQLKLDGFALSAIYENGKIQQLSSRGDGVNGENLSYLINSNKVTITGLPKTINSKEKVEIRGELYLTDTQFATVNAKRKQLTGEEFKNSRNAVAGLCNRANKGLDYEVRFSFTAYSCFINNMAVEFDDVEAVNLSTVDKVTAENFSDKVELVNLNKDTTLETVATLESLIETIEIPNDGVVIKPMLEGKYLQELGSNEHHPVSQIAYKYPTPSFATKITDITFSIGRTGKVAPVAIVEPVEVMGTVISKVSLHNYDWIQEKGIKVGATVLVTRANKVIPYVQAVVDVPVDSEDVKAPTICPQCDEDLLGYNLKTLWCPNTRCPSRSLKSILNAVGKACLDIEGMSTALVESLNKEGLLNNVADLYDLTFEQLKNVTLGYTAKGTARKLGAKRAEVILEQIKDSKNIELHKFLLVLSIPQLGSSAAKLLAKTYGNIETILSLSMKEIQENEGLGALKASDIYYGLKLNSKLIKELILKGIKIKPVNNSHSDNETSLVGKSFAISGKVPAPFSNRNEFVSYVENNGGEFHATPKPNTTYMVADSGGTSSKIKKAQQLGVTFITDLEFTEMFTKQ